MQVRFATDSNITIPMLVSTLLLGKKS